MYFCSNCKKKCENSICNSCGKSLGREDEIIFCPQCNKMYYKPNYDFNCTRCGTKVIVNPEIKAELFTQNTNQNMQSSVQNIQNNNNSNSNGNFGILGEFPKKQSIEQNVLVSNENENNKLEYNSQNNVQNDVQSGFQYNNVQNNNVSNTQFSQSATQNDLVQNSYNNSQISQNSNLNPIQNNNNLSQNGENNSQDLASLFSQNQIQDDSQTKINFDDLRNQEVLQTEDTKSQDVVVESDGKKYDENGFEIVEVDKQKKKSKSKKEKIKKESSGETTVKAKSGIGLKIFALIEFLIILGCLTVITIYLVLPYTQDTFKRAWSNYIDSYNSIAIVEGEKTLDKTEIDFIKSNDDGTMYIYKEKGKSNYIVFEVEKNFAIGSFIDFSNAQVVALFNSSIEAEEYMNAK